MSGQADRTCLSSRGLWAARGGFLPSRHLLLASLVMWEPIAVSPLVILPLCRRLQTTILLQHRQSRDLVARCSGHILARGISWLTKGHCVFSRHLRASKYQSAALGGDLMSSDCLPSTLNSISYYLAKSSADQQTKGKTDCSSSVSNSVLMPLTDGLQGSDSQQVD